MSGLTSSGYVFRAEVDATSKCMSAYAAMGLALDI